MKKVSRKKTQDELPSIPQKESIGATGPGAEFLDFVETYNLFIKTEEGECGLDPELVANPLRVTIQRVHRAIRELSIEGQRKTWGPGGRVRMAL